MSFPLYRDQEPDTGSGEAQVSTAGFAAVLAFGIASLGFHWLDPEGWFPVLDSANLALHEAGHPLVGMLGERVAVYGGTLFQLAFPLAAAWHFHRAAHPCGVGASIVWLGENLFNIARYMADARAQQLPLVGGGDHDWSEIFSRWGALHLDGSIAGITRVLGFILIAGSAVWLYRGWRKGRKRI